MSRVRGSLAASEGLGRLQGGLFSAFLQYECIMTDSRLQLFQRP